MLRIAPTGAWQKSAVQRQIAHGVLLESQKLNPAISQYRDRRFNGTQEEFEDCLRKSTTLYVGNLSFYTTEEQIFEVMPSFSHAKEAKEASSVLARRAVDRSC